MTGSFSIKTQYKIYITFFILSAKKKLSANTLLGRGLLTLNHWQVLIGKEKAVCSKRLFP